MRPNRKCGYLDAVRVPVIVVHHGPSKLHGSKGGLDSNFIHNAEILSLDFIYKPTDPPFPNLSIPHSLDCRGLSS